MAQKQTRPEILRLSEADIRRRTTGKTWVRGLQYFQEGHVLQAVWRGATLTARVQGSEYMPYVVHVSFTPEGNLQTATCTCPYEGMGDCKHIVAVLLYLLHHAQDVPQRASLEELLESMSREELIELIHQLAAAHPEVIELIETFRHVPRVENSVRSGLSPEVDVAAPVRSLRTELYRLAQAYFYDPYAFEEELPFTELFDPLLEQVQAQLAEGKPREALAALETLTTAWQEACRETHVEWLIQTGLLEDEPWLQKLGMLWAEALLSLELSAEEREHWIRRLARWVRSLPDGEALEIAVTAVRQGWDDPALVAAMQGHITEQGVWEGEPPDFADDLAIIRLRILERQGRVQEFLNLAQAEGQYVPYVRKLVEIGQYDRAVEEARVLLASPAEIIEIVKALWAHHRQAEAFALAEYGLELPETLSRVDREELAAWLRDQAESVGQRELARKAAWEALRINPTHDNYRRLVTLLGSEWPAVRERALEMVEAHALGPEEAVKIFLEENECERAMRVVEGSRWCPEAVLLEVIEAVRAIAPTWAFTQCRARAEAIMDAGRSDAYHEAVHWLQKGQDILREAGDLETWQRYLASLLDKHQRKYKLRPMLEQLKL
ncbi:zinc finger SWIM domain-containing protein [Rhodothermus marinus SG0.5JP17-172]|uniref:SWIM zinc finger family protein n=1 Tax=Rhodothermus marinus TaxID=29549 RepID=UPI000223D6E6|nr:SWIM zinc finger family protein [Rhodothermus marinus]AEN73299.1 zinc finger SWIM domain-containing protein [Rhodothermus marinus SG0.5JP17-172]